MPTLTIQQNPPQITLAPLDRAQVCYVLLTITAQAQASRAVNWALVADASRSMRIPIVSEAAFRALIQQGGAQETLVDGVPVWQLREPVPPAMRAAALSPLDHVARALHSIVERLDGEDRLTLVACAEEASRLTRSTSGAERTTLVHGIERLAMLNLGDETDLALGLRLALDELQRGRDRLRVDRLLLLTDGFTRQPEVCVALAAEAARAGVTITTVGLGGEFQEQLLTTIADTSGGRALFLPQPDAIPRAVAQELARARAVTVRALGATVTLTGGVELRRITRIRPALAVLHEPPPGQPSGAGVAQVGDLSAGEPLALLLELLVPPGAGGARALGRVAFASAGSALAEHALAAVASATLAATAPEVAAAAAAHANVARLQRRAAEALARGILPEATRLFSAVAARLDELGEPTLAAAARQQAAALAATGQPAPLAQKALTYATRRLGDEDGAMRTER